MLLSSLKISVVRKKTERALYLIKRGFSAIASMQQLMPLSTRSRLSCCQRHENNPLILLSYSRFLIQVYRQQQAVR